MTRVSTSFLLVTVLALSRAALIVAQAPTSTCVINTPQEALQEGKSYTITWSNCKGRADIFVNYGDDTQDLDKTDTPACEDVQLEDGHCTYIPEDHGEGYSLSLVDPSLGESDPNAEVFTGPFTILKKKEEVHPKKDSDNESGKGEKEEARNQQKPVAEQHSTTEAKSQQKPVAEQHSSTEAKSQQKSVTEQHSTTEAKKVVQKRSAKSAKGVEKAGHADPQESKSGKGDEGKGAKVEGEGAKVEGKGAKVEGKGAKVEGEGAKVEGKGAKVE
ncbi:hypothetical protein BGZ83_000952, partial [Gryganskiella cystojenkinii]